MKYEARSTFKGRRRFGRHGSGGHQKNKPGSKKGGISGPCKPSVQRYFDSLRWIENKRRRIARHKKAIRHGE